MSTVTELHHEAMELADLAFVARFRGDVERVKDLSAQAYNLEIEAAKGIPNVLANEPTRSILYLSAASLACEAGATPEVIERVAADGLAGYPQGRTAQALRELLFQLWVNTGSIDTEGGDDHER